MLDIENRSHEFCDLNASCKARRTTDANMYILK